MKFLNLFILSFLLFTQIDSVKAEQLSDEARNKIQKAEDYINGIKTMQAGFVQLSPYNKDGASNMSVSYGTFFLSRPGKAVWKYTIPTPIKITINDSKLAYYDEELDQISYTSIEGNLSAILTNKEANILGGDFDISGFRSDAYGFTFVVNNVVKPEESEKELKEQVLLTFLEDPFRLHVFKYKDLNGYVTTIEFKDHEYNVDLDEDLFKFSNPRIGKDAWERNREN